MESKELAQEAVEALTYLLEYLGFTINSAKSVKDPTHVLEFLGLATDTN